MLKLFESKFCLKFSNELNELSLIHVNTAFIKSVVKQEKQTRSVEIVEVKCAGVRAHYLCPPSVCCITACVTIYDCPTQFIKSNVYLVWKLTLSWPPPYDNSIVGTEQHHGGQELSYRQ